MKLSFFSALTLFLTRCAHLIRIPGTASNQRNPSSNASIESSPIQIIPTDSLQTLYTGDQPTFPHSVLWNIENALQEASHNPPSRKAKIVIIGGGISGLICAHELQEHSPVLLEQAPQFGGNSKGESWQNIPYALGAAYMIEPEPGSRIQNLFEELGLNQTGRTKGDTETDPVWYKKKIYSELTDPTLDPSHLPLYLRHDEYFSDYLNGKNGKKLPNFPPQNQKDWDWISRLDRQTFMEDVSRSVGGKIPAPLQTAIEHYCWSSMGASAHQLSAAAMANIYSLEYGKTRAFPGGNSAISHALHERLTKRLQPENMMTQSTVARVRKTQEGIEVFYFDSDKNLHRIETEKVIFACPKFIVKKIFPELEETRKIIFSEIEYTSYLVANLLLKNPGSRQSFYDLYRLDEANGRFSRHGSRKTPQGVALECDRQKTTDLVWADWALGENKKSDHAVLSLYRAIPHTMGRAALLAPGSYEKYKKEFEQEVQTQIFPTLNLPRKSLHDIRVTRWGHPLPVAKKGLYSNTRLAQACKSLDHQIYYAHQDNWAIPAFETSAAEAFRVADEIRHLST